ncbi:MAG: hypothetical protein ABIS03_09115 [Gemmatimonadaceae bacterium]
MTPLISIILPADTAARIRPVLDHLRQQLLGRSVEIVVVIPHVEAGMLDPDEVTIVPVNSIYPLNRARAVAIRAAAGEFVFMGETHSFPRRGMFHAILAAHGSGATVVVPMLENENPTALVSWAGFLSGYASWTQGRERGKLDSAPLFNVSYSKSFLISLGESLESVMLSREDVTRSVAGFNGSIFFEPAAKVGHVNIARSRDWLSQRVVAGRTIGSMRSASWTHRRRFAYALAFPLIPVVLMRKHRRGISRTMRVNRLSNSVLPVLALGMYFQAWGEMLGYVLGNSSSAWRRYDEYEIRLLDFR